MKKLKKLGESGTTMLEWLVAGVLLTLSILFAMRDTTMSSRQVASSRDTVYAEILASELLELFRMMTTAQLRAYLSTNPNNAAAPPYAFCSHINIINRTNGAIVNPDPIATLPPNTIDIPEGSFRANRYYQVTVVNYQTMAVNPVWCTRLPNGADVFAPEDRFLVTVGVTWIPKGKPATDVRQAILSAMIPG